MFLNYFLERVSPYLYHNGNTNKIRKKIKKIHTKKFFYFNMISGTAFFF
jgi:hypothetical protein